MAPRPTNTGARATSARMSRSPPRCRTGSPARPPSAECSRTTGRCSSWPSMPRAASHTRLVCTPGGCRAAYPLLTGGLGAGPRQPWPDDSIGSRALWVLSAFGPHPLEGAEVFGPHANEAVVFEDVADFVFTQ